jgi:hypothetical protein
MDLQAAETAHQRDPRDQISYTKKDWACPCNGCAKAVKQERKRILEEIENIDINSSSQLNALGMKILIKEIVSPSKKK